MDISAKIEHLVDRFNQMDSWEERYKEIINIGRKTQGIEEEKQQEKFRVKGCQSQVWLIPSLNDGKIFFLGDSDAVLVKGIISVLLEVYSGHSPEDILKTSPDFLRRIGITEHLSMNRSNGLASMAKQIQMYAVAFKSLTDKGVMNVDSL